MCYTSAVVQAVRRFNIFLRSMKWCTWFCGEHGVHGSLAVSLGDDRVASEFIQAGGVQHSHLNAVQCSAVYSAASSAVFSAVSSAVCSLQCSQCAMQRAACSVQRAVCSRSPPGGRSRCRGPPQPAAWSKLEAGQQVATDLQCSAVQVQCSIMQYCAV
jgi:hypothetical protein